MKKIFMAATAALCFAGGSIAQENPGGDKASKFASGDIDKPEIVAAAIGLGIIGGMAANTRGGTKDRPVVDDPDDPVEPVDPVCGAGEELVDGECVPVTITTTATSTTTVTSTNSVTSTITTPVTVTVTSTSL